MPISLRKRIASPLESEARDFEIMFFLVRYRLVGTSRWIHHMANAPDEGKSSAVAVKRILDTTQMLKIQYLCHLDPRKPFHWQTVTFTRLMNAKLWPPVYQSMSFHSAKLTLSGKEQMFSK